MKAGLGAALGAASVVAFVLLIAIIVAVEPDQNGAGGTGGGALAGGSVPEAFGPWLQKAGGLCPQIGAPLLAAQLAQESGFSPNAVSPSGAQGPAQFMPGTWPSWGQDDDANGRVSPFDVGDAVMAQGRYMCALAAQMTQALAAGRVQGSVSDLALGAYNAGPGGVLASGGVPHNGETDAYVARINAAIAKYSGADQAPGPGTLATNDASLGSNVVLAAQRWIGQRYVWGGGDVTGPAGGGFDCSGLALNAVYTASGGRIILPHNAAAQATLGTPVPADQLHAGDLLFFANSPAAPPHHVGVYIGGAQMIDAPDLGQSVRVTPLGTPYYRTQTITARRYG